MFQKQRKLGKQQKEMEAIKNRHPSIHCVWPWYCENKSKAEEKLSGHFGQSRLLIKSPAVWCFWCSLPARNFVVVNCWLPIRFLCSEAKWTMAISDRRNRPNETTLSPCKVLSDCFCFPSINEVMVIGSDDDNDRREEEVGIGIKIKNEPRRNASDSVPWRFPTWQGQFV